MPVGFNHPHPKHALTALRLIVRIPQCGVYKLMHTLCAPPLVGWNSRILSSRAHWVPPISLYIASLHVICAFYSELRWTKYNVSTRASKNQVFLFSSSLTRLRAFSSPSTLPNFQLLSLSTSEPARRVRGEGSADEVHYSRTDDGGAYGIRAQCEAPNWIRHARLSCYAE